MPKVQRAVLDFGPDLSLTFQYQSTGEGERQLRQWIDDTAREQGRELRQRLASASPARSGTLAASWTDLYDFPVLIVATEVQYARFQPKVRDALTRESQRTDARFRGLTKRIAFPLRYAGVWTINLGDAFGGLALSGPFAGTLAASFVFRFSDFYRGYQRHNDVPFGVSYSFRLPEIDIPIKALQ